MPRILGVDIPGDKRVDIALRYIYGIGPVNAKEVLARAGIDAAIRAKNLNEQQPLQSLRMVPGAQTQLIVSGEPGLRTVMIGKSNFRESSDIVWVVTRMYYKTLFYLVCVAPEEDSPRTTRRPSNGSSAAFN